MRVAVIGGTGLVGRAVVSALQRSGHDPVTVSRAQGVDVVTGAGLDQALSGAEAVVDASNLPATEREPARRDYGAAAHNLLAAEARAGVRHHVLLSIVGLDRIQGNAHYEGKRAQEEAAASGRVPYTIQRATQFHEFAGMVAEWTRQGDTASVPPALVQPVSVPEVGAVLAEVAVGAPVGRAPDLAGPLVEDLFDMARRTFAARGQALRLVPGWKAGPYGVEAAGEILLPGPGARIAATTFDAWLAEQAAARA